MISETLQPHRQMCERAVTTVIHLLEQPVRNKNEGRETVIDIDDKLLLNWPLPGPDPQGDKNSRGRILIIAGSQEMPGTAILSGLAALRAGAGKVQIATGKSIAQSVAAAILEGKIFALPETLKGGIAPDAADAILEQAQRADSILIGPGLVDEESIIELLARLFSALEGKPLLLDAGALPAVKVLGSHMKMTGNHVLITPHVGEMAKLLGRDAKEIINNPVIAARDAVQKWKVNVVLKGAETFVALFDGKLYAHRGGNIGLATGGSGDILAGLMGGLLARGASPGQAAAWAIFIHACAGEKLSRTIGPLGFLARELLPEIPAFLSKVGKES
jgi:ADP-dependent NAD(P)H-hydrate dehydratase